MVAALKVGAAGTDERLVRRLVALTLAIAAVAAPARAATLSNWDRADQHAAARAGLLHVLDDGAFHGERPLSAAQLRQARDALAGRLAVAPVDLGDLGPRVSVSTFDRALVRQLGLSDVAAHVQWQARRAGLHPPARFGTEVVARQLGLRFNHPYPQERLELYPWDAITRAEAAYSLARVAQFGGWEVQAARDTLARFVLPRYTAVQRRALRIAVAKIGMPYIWGGEADTRSSFFGGQVHGGYDCSGFAWRVFKLSGLPAGRRIRGRTAAQQAGETSRSQRIRLSAVRPGDLLFFGPGRFWQKATERRIVHEGIALSADFMIHASSQGVYVAPLFDDWRRAEFSWARRIL
jgi:cell wall-associated NlpC family hydrolase